MIKNFLSLEWKQFSRSVAFQQKMVAKIFMGIFALLISLEVIAAGVFAYLGLKKEFPDNDPLEMICNGLMYYFIVDLLFRYFLQKLPVLNIKPIMVLPIKKRTTINFLLGKGLVSFFNLLPLFFYTPLVIVLLVNGYNPLGVLVWFIGMLCITCTINFLNFLVNKSNVYFGVIAVLLVGVVGLAYYNYFNAAPYVGSFLYAMYTKLYMVVVPIVLFGLVYYLNYRLLATNFYIDGVINKKVKDVEAKELSFLNRFGKVAPFLKNDIKMISRNKRPRQVIFVSLMFLFYGLVFFTNAVYDKQLWIKPFAGMFISGGFLMTFGQNVPSWDSEYYKLMMSQNIPYRTYLESKWYLMVVATLVAMLLSLPYAYFGKEVFYIVLGAGFFNVGLNSFVVLWSGVFNKTAIPLNEKTRAFSNTQGFNATMLLIAFPKLLLPVILFFVPYYFTSSVGIGATVLGASGIIGIALKNKIFNGIVHLYQKEKYKTIAAYSGK